MTNENLYHSLRECEKAFLHHLNARRAKYVVIGSHAVLLYAPDRRLGGANDLDVAVDCSKENAVKVFAAAQACGYKPPEGETEEGCIARLSQEETVLRFPYGGTRNGDPIEVVTSIGSEVLSFDDLWRDPRLVSVSVWVENKMSEFEASFVTKAHLMQLKQEAIDDQSRKEKSERDRMDLEDLRRSPYC